MRVHPTVIVQAPHQHGHSRGTGQLMTASKLGATFIGARIASELLGEYKSLNLGLSFHFGRPLCNQISLHLLSDAESIRSIR